LKEDYGQAYTIGYSDHSIGIHIPLAAVSLGAEVIEKHVTLDKNMKGTDHKGSAEPQEMKELVHNIRTFERSLGKDSIFKDDSVQLASKKLERSLAVRNDMTEGDVLTRENVYMISPGDGLKWDDMKNLVGKKINKKLEKNTLLSLEDVN
jgi:sialic acid synthase